MTQDSQIIRGNCLTALPSVQEKSVQSCITSPPYWGLRDYGTATWKGGLVDCDHLSDRSSYEKNYANSKQASNKGTGNRDIIPHGVCPRCGAIREDDQIGLESSPEKYVASLVDVFRAVKRVLRDDGTLWLNLGDSYGGMGLKPKNLAGIPWRVAFALQADGWYLRQDIIWHKPNPMPEPVKDRCTKSHEYIFLLSKSPKYYFNHEKIQERQVSNSGSFNGSQYGMKSGANGDSNDKGRGGIDSTGKRNKRDVWTVNIHPYKEAHFATFPRKLIEPCILAGSKAGDTILDPFTGSGTTGLVSVENGRNFLGIELNPEYKKMAETRINSAQPFLL